VASCTLTCPDFSLFSSVGLILMSHVTVWWPYQQQPRLLKASVQQGRKQPCSCAHTGASRETVMSWAICLSLDKAESSACTATLTKPVASHSSGLAIAQREIWEVPKLGTWALMSPTSHPGKSLHGRTFSATSSGSHSVQKRCVTWGWVYQTEWLLHIFSWHPLVWPS
jgi:hypothetical protein